MAKENASSATGTGTDTLEVRGADTREIDPNAQQGRDIRERTGDPNAARKAIIARHAALTQADREIDLETVPGAKALQGGYVEDGDAGTTDGDADGDGAVQPQRDPVATDADQGVDSAPVGEDVVTLKVFGKEIQKSRAEVEAAGGVDALQIQLAAQERLRRGGEHLVHAEEDARRAQELAQIAADRRRAFNEQLKALNGTASRPTGTPAAATPATDSAVSQPASATTPAPRGQVDESQIENLVTELYSGDPDRAKVALADVLAAVRGSPNGMTLEQMTALARAQFDTEWAEREATAAKKVQVDAVNSLMSDRYSNILEDPQLRYDCAHLYNAEVANPKNRGRPLVVIADEVATRVLGRAGIVDAPNADVSAAVNQRTSFKRRIPAASSATDRVPAQEAQPDYPTAASDVVKLLRAARHQPVY